MSINVGYAVRDSLSNFRRNWVMSLGAVVTIFLSLLVIGIFLVGGTVVDTIVNSVESKVSIQVFLSDDAAKEDVNSLQKWIEANPDVKAVDYTSKEAALKKFEENTSTSGIAAGLDKGKNPLPASLDVELVDPQQVKTVANEILENPTFKKVASTPANPERDLRYGQDIIDKLFTVTNIIRVIAIALVALLSVVALIFINNTIRLAIYARRKEIGVMRLVGASNGFIRAPFLVEGMLQSLIGAALAIGVIFAMISLLLPKVSNAITWLPVVITQATEIKIFLILLAFGLLMGLLGSTMSMRRYLKI